MLGISDSFRKLEPEEVGPLAAELDSAWQDPAIPLRQWIGVVRGELERLRAGQSLPHFDVLLRALQKTQLEYPTLLEIGASSGFYSEILKALGYMCQYVGLDYSEEYRKLALSLFPTIDFHVADARALPFTDGEFHIVVSGCCLLHIADYPKAIAEAARVASKFAIFNRTPVLTKSPTEFYEKNAYGVRCLEIHFNHSELLDLFAMNGLELVSFEDVAQEPEGAVRYRCYLLKK